MYAGRSEYQLLEISLNDHVLNRAHCNFEKIGIRSICEVTVYLSRGCSIQSYELVHEVFASLLPALGVALEILKAEFCDGASCNLRLEQIDLVQEKDKC